MNNRSRRYTALFVVSLAAFFPPILGAFNRPVWLGWVPLLPAYIFAVWVAVVCLAWLGGRGDKS